MFNSDYLRLNYAYFVEHSDLPVPILFQDEIYYWKFCLVILRINCVSLLLSILCLLRITFHLQANKVQLIELH